MTDSTSYTGIPLSGSDNYTALSGSEETYSMPTGTQYDTSGTSQQAAQLANHHGTGIVPQNYGFGQYMLTPQSNTGQMHQAVHHNGMAGYAPMQEGYTNWNLPPSNQIIPPAQNFLPPLGQTLISTTELTRLQDNFSSTMEKVNVAINRLEKLEADVIALKQKDSEVGKARKGKKSGEGDADGPRPSTEAENFVQAKFQSAVGISNPVGRGKKWAIPPPLEADDAPRMNATGTTRLWNPDWRQSSTTSTNQEFIDHLVELLLSEEEHKDEDKRLLSNLPSGKCKKMVTTYFNNTARRWKSENFEASGEKAKANEARTRRQLRKKRAATKMRQGAQVLAEKLGDTACVGIDELIHTEWMDSQHSTSGEANDEEWENRRVAMGGGANQKGIELRQKEWVSPWLRKLWGYMLSVAREADEQAKARPASNQELMRFRGPSANSNTSAPPMATNLKPCRNCVRDSWAEAHPHHVFPSANTTHTAMQIDVAMAVLDPRYVAYYECDADDEGEVM
ncbi:uncharacterized protein STEHIDRAFT_164143 [Stereum hirsutum FP-91666 SS1]|uniref:Uncharacterized protein n=1 Tax=Stereum hirsutum (strain FP-91666) TaxID=721885 RepID=R7RX61_STEHR|nr:uncharacterized protein STEHIDRAFT_159391 [Stereum hirsutum FP-91666 SS1]XP_007309770.1 uncharacterized protein STEHIDRAFT_162089 [Stereum hirsutum FP-91666 SS1]XP_007311930.1 uncharacterized protein STEHIDRAFT_164143 [Stereum hirsutum FP-91666 SS1]EIM78972.1 hypothetical protein STEHIDRAFT_164143 [Stereum hirsutum FP-91666 SS1]EIM81091.1 hypothetical protein STEHIDRAFT_162089 [Stereum hirsutum FP-91666 SS1]EIM83767.1 hypothetical protein STEHIDRAFT_159391 [Stereum hirsutum FP-91666 SS1]